jgi:hypothetical protein
MKDQKRQQGYPSEMVFFHRRTRTVALFSNRSNMLLGLFSPIDRNITPGIIVVFVFPDQKIEGVQDLDIFIDRSPAPFFFRIPAQRLKAGTEHPSFGLHVPRLERVKK